MLIKILNALFRLRVLLYHANLLSDKHNMIRGNLADGRKVIIVWESGGKDVVNDYPIDAYVQMVTDSEVDALEGGSQN